MNSFSRRSFIKSTSMLGAATALSPRLALASSTADQVNIGIVGCGWRGGQLLKFFQGLPGVEIAGLCDVDRELVDQLGESAPKAQKWTDLRQMFDAPEIDAVVIATCNHWHCLAAIWAMQAGKHVYVEKPLGHTEWEGQQVVNASAKYNRICQVGTQQRSDPMQAEIKQFLHEDKLIGGIDWVRVNRFGVREQIGRRSEPLNVPKTVDFDLWVGPAQKQPILREKLHYDWHWDWNTGSGEMGNWGVHILDDVRNNVFRDTVSAPASITAAGGRFAWGDAGNTPNAHFAVLDTGEIPVVVSLTNLPFDKKQVKVPGPASGYIVYCDGGRLEGQRGRATAFDKAGKLIKKFAGKGGNELHQQNFIDAIRQGKPELLVAPAQVGNDSTTWCNLINIATRVPSEGPAEQSNESSFQVGPRESKDILAQLNSIVAANELSDPNERLQIGPTLQFDATARQFVGDQAEAANSLLRRRDREPFVVPEISAT